MNLPIFPEGALASSVITTVWVGVFVISFFNLRFGWVLSGLVVPGYLVPLIIVRPIAAAVITVEAILTYLLVWLFSEKFGGRWWSSLFGRDRFMGLILASIAVRGGLDGWALPHLADWLATNWDRQFDWQSNLQSFGLVVISLLANQFWKPGLARGLGSMIVVTALSWLIVRYGLMEFTNFRISGVSYLYEGLASSVLASPKAYMILVITAFIASQMNVRYGWDFSGILIPALMALQWYQPTKILSSFVEAAVIYVIARLLLKLPLLANASIEGARKLLYFFNVSFAYKLLLGHAIVLLGLEVKISDYYGFGYLLSTLLAIKAYEKDIFARVMRNTFEISIAGAALGNLAGLALTAIVPASMANAAARGAKAQADGDSEVERLFRAAVGDAWVQRAGSGSLGLTANQSEALVATVEQLEAGARPAELAPWLAASGFEMREGAGRVAIARMGEGGRDLLLFNPQATRKLAVILDDPASQSGLAAAALQVFESQNARWLLVTSPVRESAVVLTAMQDSFGKGSRDTWLTVRAAPSGAPSRAEFVRRSAVAVDIAGMRRALPGLAIDFAPVTLAHHRDEAVLALAPGDIARLVADERVPPAAIGPSIDLKGDGAIAVEAGAQDDMAATCTIDPAAGELPPPDVAQLAYMRFEVVEPLLAALAAKAGDAPAARRSARLAGFGLTQCQLGGRLQWRLASPQHGGGTMFFAASGDRSQIIQSYAGPERHVLAAAAEFYLRGNAGALLVAPNREALSEGPQSYFGMTGQAILRDLGDNPGSVVQLRPALLSAAPLPLTGSDAPEGKGDMIIALDWVEQRSPLAQQLAAMATASGYRARLADRSSATAGYELTPGWTFRYLEQSANKRFAIVWLPLKQEVAP